ncbi:MAG: exonuclease, partial [Alphaproteobacteria bacterium]|nr:exonuclease [Alphaproteobacteria bacterium]
MEQRSEEWFKERLGHLTASRASDAIAKAGTATRRNYAIQLVTERLTGLQTESFTNAAMQRGTEQEPIARAAYEAHTGVFVEQTGFHKHPTIKWLGASPDGFAGSGLIEIKCPNSNTHVDYLISKEVPAKYKPQMLTQLIVTGRTWCDFVSFDPRLPDHLQLFIVRYEPTQKDLKTIEIQLVTFLAEV